MAYTFEIVNLPTNTGTFVLPALNPAFLAFEGNEKSPDGLSDVTYYGYNATGIEKQHELKIEVKRQHTRSKGVITKTGFSIRIRGTLRVLDGTNVVEENPVDSILAVNFPGTTFAEVSDGLTLASLAYYLWHGSADMATSPDEAVAGHLASNRTTIYGS